MPNYKVVNSDQLDSDITVVADAIRARSGASGKLAFPNGMADAVRSIPSGGGAELPKLDNPASPEDMVSGKSLYNHYGSKVDGVVKDVSTVYTTPVQKATMEYDDDWKVSNVLEEDVLLRKGTAVNTWLSQNFFGNAKPADVRKGVTFTAGSNLCKEGTMETGSDGGGLIMKTGTTTSNVIETGLSDVEQFFIYKKTQAAAGLILLHYSKENGTSRLFSTVWTSYSKSINSGTDGISISGGTATIEETSAALGGLTNGVTYTWFAVGT